MLICWIKKISEVKDAIVRYNPIVAVIWGPEGSISIGGVIIAPEMQ